MPSRADRSGAPGSRAPSGAPGSPAPNSPARAGGSDAPVPDGVALGPEFFARDAHLVARELIGCVLLYQGRGGPIVETESYVEDDPACHAFNGRTARNDPLYGPPGTAYVYRSYGIHDLLNFVVQPEGSAAAVLIRALEPAVAVEEIRARRPGRGELELCAGPGRLTRALGIGAADNRRALDAPPFAVLPPAEEPPEVVTAPRVGISRATEYPWRFCAAGSRFVSRPRP